MPTFTIITATYNAAATLPRLLDSLAAQTCRDFNVIIQDGASKDDTVAIAESYRDKLPELLLESAPDTGIYDAWNRALTRAGDKLGGWVLFLGADDMLAGADVLEYVATGCHSAGKHIDFISYTLGRMTEEGEILPEIFAVPHDIIRDSYKGMPFGHPALFHRKALFQSELFLTSYKIASDYEFILRKLHDNSQIAVDKKLVTYMAKGGISSCQQFDSLKEFETNQIRKKYFPIKYYKYILEIFWWKIKITTKKLLYKNNSTKKIWDFLKNISDKIK